MWSATATRSWPMSRACGSSGPAWRRWATSAPPPGRNWPSTCGTRDTSSWSASRPERTARVPGASVSRPATPCGSVTCWSGRPSSGTSPASTTLPACNDARTCIVRRSHCSTPRGRSPRRSGATSVTTRRVPPPRSMSVPCSPARRCSPTDTRSPSCGGCGRRWSAWRWKGSGSPLRRTAAASASCSSRASATSLTRTRTTRTGTARPVPPPGSPSRFCGGSPRHRSP